MVAIAVAVVGLATAGGLLVAGGAISDLPGDTPQGGADATATPEPIPANDSDGIVFTSCTRAVVDADNDRVEVELTAYDGGTQLHTYEHVNGTTAFTVSKAGLSPDRWFVSGIGVGQGYDYVAALNPAFSRGRTGELSCGSRTASTMLDREQ